MPRGAVRCERRVSRHSSGAAGSGACGWQRFLWLWRAGRVGSRCRDCKRCLCVEPGCEASPLGKSDPGSGIRRVKRERLLKQRNRLLECCGRVMTTDLPRLQEQCVGLWVGGLRVGRCAEQLDLELIDHRGGDLVLHLEHVRHRAVVALRPQVRTVSGTDQLRGDAQCVAGLAHAAFEHVSDVELLRDVGNVGLPALERK